MVSGRLDVLAECHFLDFLADSRVMLSLTALPDSVRREYSLVFAEDLRVMAAAARHSFLTIQYSLSLLN